MASQQGKFPFNGNSDNNFNGVLSDPKNHEENSNLFHSFTNPKPAVSTQSLSYKNSFIENNEQMLRIPRAYSCYISNDKSSNDKSQNDKFIGNLNIKNVLKGNIFTDESKEGENFCCSEGVIKTSKKKSGDNCQGMEHRYNMYDIKSQKKLRCVLKNGYSYKFTEKKHYDQIKRKSDKNELISSPRSQSSEIAILRTLKRKLLSNYRGENTKY